MRRLSLTVVLALFFALLAAGTRPERGFAVDDTYLLRGITEKLDKIIENQNKMMEDIKDLKSKVTGGGKGDDNYQTERTERDTEVFKGR